MIRFPVTMQRIDPRQVALLLVFASLAMFVVVIEPARRQIDTLESAAFGSDEHGRGGDDFAHAQFLANFPELAETPTAVGALWGAARDSGVELAQGEYRLVESAQAADLLRYEIIFPLQGSYPQIRTFISRATAALPFMAVDAVTFERRQISEASVHARIKLTLFVRKGST